MRFEWDEQKRQSNLRKHGIDFVIAFQLWESPMLIIEDTRIEYGEIRWVGLGVIAKRVMVIVYTQRPFGIVRLISLRKANKREVTYYEKAIKQKKARTI